MIRKSLLPDSVKNPLVFLFVTVPAKLILAALTLSSYFLLKGLFTADHRVAWLTVLAVLGGLIGVELIGALGLGKARKRVPLWMGLVQFLLNAVYLTVVCVVAGDLFPSDAGGWISSPGSFMFAQFALCAPALIYGIVMVAMRPLPVGRWMDAGISVAALVGVPLAAYLCSFVLANAVDINVPQQIAMVLFFCGTALMFLAFLRVLLMVGGYFFRYPLVIALFAGLVFPLAGLALNSKVPFPFDLQHWAAYSLTILNGVVLVWPRSDEPPKALTLWLVRAALYPFSLYFFLLFLPFLPFSMVAMLAMGAGFLILAPTVLFVVHTQRLWREGAQLAEQFGRAKIGGLFGLMLLLIPAALTGYSLLHKRALMQAVTAIYQPDFSSDTVSVNRKSAAFALEQLARQKDGIYTPFISEYYNRLVFGGMTLPDYKMDELYRTLTGSELDRGTGRDMNLMSFLTGSQNRIARWDGVRPPPRNVTLADLQIRREAQGGLTEMELELVMQNGPDRNAEFVTSLEIPSGTFVSGYALKVGDEWVPGRIFDRKTAMWVYHMIRDSTNRDPGLLVYENARTVKLSIFPFSENQERRCRIKLLAPVSSRDDLRVGDRVVAGLQGGGTVLSMETFGKGRAIYWPGKTGAEFAFERKPYLHFIVDATESAAEHLPCLAQELTKRAAQFPRAAECMVTLANVNSYDVTERPIPLTEMSECLQYADYGDAGQGGFCPELAACRALEKYRRAEWRQTYVPVFIPVKFGKNEAVSAQWLDDSLGLVPDAVYSFPQEEPGRADDAARTAIPVVLLRCGSEVRAVDAERGGLSCFESDEPIEVFDPAQNKFVPLQGALELDADSAYAQAVGLWAAYEKTVRVPARTDSMRSEMLARSRASGILQPLAAYIVVENSAQWEMMQRKERQALANNGALEFDEFESPEPSLWVMIPLVFLALWGARIRRA
jgi:hypothetical protein